MIQQIQGTLARVLDRDALKFEWRDGFEPQLEIAVKDGYVSVKNKKGEGEGLSKAERAFVEREINRK